MTKLSNRFFLKHNTQYSETSNMKHFFYYLTSLYYAVTVKWSSWNERLGERQENKVINLGKITLTGQISNKGEKNLGQINQPTNKVTMQKVCLKFCVPQNSFSHATENSKKTCPVPELVLDPKLRRTLDMRRKHIQYKQSLRLLRYKQ